MNRSVPQVRPHFLHELNDLPGGVEVADRFGYAERQPVAHVLEGDPHRLVGYPVVEGRAVGRGVVRNPYCLHRPPGECAGLFLGDLLGPSHGAYVVRHVLRRQVLVAAHSISPFDYGCSKGPGLSRLAAPARKQRSLSRSNPAPV